MTRPAADSVAVVWTGTGTGTMSLGANVSGRQSFPSTANGLPVSYEIEHETATERENGIGTYTTAGNTLSRDLVTFSTAGGTTKVTFSAGNKFVRLTVLAHDVIENRATTSPTVNDDINDGYIAGRARWLNTSTDVLYFCEDHTVGAAKWTAVGGSAAVTSVNGLTGAVLLDAANLNAVHAPANYSPVGSPSADIESHLSGIDTALGALSVGSDATPVQVTSNASPFALAIDSRVHNNREIFSHTASVDFEVPATAPAGSKWYIQPLHTGCTVSNAGDVGSVTPALARLVFGGAAIVEVRSNAGSAPVTIVRGDVIVPATDTGVKTYTDDDANQDFRVTSGTQTFGAVANFRAGFYCNIFREVAGSITIDGLDADYILAGPDAVTVIKIGTAMLAIGKAGVVILDAS